MDVADAATTLGLIAGRRSARVGSTDAGRARLHRSSCEGAAPCVRAEELG